MAVCIAVIGKDNSPQFIACADTELELQCHYKVHTSLDIVEEKLSSIATAEVRKLYLGLLHSTEEHKIYGYVTNTKIKFIIIVKTSNVTLRDNDVHTMFKKLHNCYVNIVSNPFYIPGDPLVSRMEDLLIYMMGNCTNRRNEFPVKAYLFHVDSYQVLNSFLVKSGWFWQDEVFNSLYEMLFGFEIFAVQKIL